MRDAVSECGGETVVAGDCWCGVGDDCVGDAWVGVGVLFVHGCSVCCVCGWRGCIEWVMVVGVLSIGLVCCGVGGVGGFGGIGGCPGRGKYGFTRSRWTLKHLCLPDVSWMIVV